MKIKKVVLVCMFLICVMGAIPHASQAHELLPKALLEYVDAHPDATSEQIEAFVREQTPEFAEKYKDKEKILDIIRDRKTSFWDNMYDFTKIGIHHILSGLDHILFVISLILVFISIREVLRLTFTFTLAHSITLVLAGTGLLVLSSRIVEPMIALSISFVAITSVFFAHKKWIGGTRAKVAMVFGFGLFHGLGFAGLLQEIHVPQEKFVSSLLAFNIGIEIGQLMIVCLALPLIYLARNKSWYPYLIKTLSIVIGILGIVWATQRVFA
jgi:hydrogenase/urease accessory protein HupE